MASEFDIYRQDLQALACTRTLEVFSRDTILRGIQASIINQTQELHDSIIDAMPARTLDNAAGYNLDVLGRLVGLFPRPLIDADQEPWIMRLAITSTCLGVSLGFSRAH